MMKEKVKKFIEEKIDLIEWNTKDSWEKVYAVLWYQLKGKFTETLLSADINPAAIMGYIPKHYLYDSNIPNYKIPNNVTSIGYRAFYMCGSLTSIEIPNSVTSVGKEAFWYCISLTNAIIGNSVKSIGSHAFRNCNSLRNVILGDSVESIDFCAFCDCPSLASIAIPDSVISIGQGAFEGCNSLVNIVYKGSIKEFNIVDKSPGWNYNVPATKVICTDGEIEL